MTLADLDSYTPHKACFWVDVEYIAECLLRSDTLSTARSCVFGRLALDPGRA